LPQAGKRRVSQRKREEERGKERKREEEGV
jgi:hypothetical protein